MSGRLGSLQRLARRSPWAENIVPYGGEQGKCSLTRLSASALQFPGVAGVQGVAAQAWRPGREVFC